MKNFLFITLILFSSFKSNAQDDLLSMLGSGDETNYTAYTFKGTKVINGESVEIPAEGVLQFLIQHRFGTLNSGLYNLYGLDNSQIRLGFDYGIKDWASVGVGRSSTLKTVDANVKIRLKRQSTGIKEFPYTIVFHSAAFLNQYQINETEQDRFLFSNQLSYSNQLLIAKKISRDLSIQFSPTVVHYNIVPTSSDKNDLFSVGLGGRKKLTKRLSVNAEYFFQIDENTNPNSFSLGLDIETGGHVFQLHVTNSVAMFERGFIHENSGTWKNGDIYFGFNISRVFTINK